MNRKAAIAVFLLAIARAEAQAPSPTPPVTGSPAPLPDTAALLTAVLENLDRVDSAREDYAATKTVTETEVDGKGRIKKQVERTYDVFYPGGRSVNRLIAENGQPLNQARALKEQEKVEKIIRENHERRSREGRRDGKQAEAKEDDDDEPSASRVLRLCRFTNGRRESVKGRDVLVYDFEPRPDTRAKGRVESWIQKMSGQVRIDEAAGQLLRLDARVDDSLQVGGGVLLSVQKGSFLVLEQELVRGEIWLPSYAEVQASTRLLLMKTLRTNQVERFSDYRKFEVDTSSEMKTLKP